MAAVENVPVIFRKEKDGDITAVFPALPASYDAPMTCYAHIGQHSACSHGWYVTTKPASEAEYADLLAELRRIYEESEDPVKLTVRKRITAKMRDELRRALRG